jgi:hypothetical protein
VWQLTVADLVCTRHRKQAFYVFTDSAGHSRGATNQKKLVPTGNVWTVIVQPGLGAALDALAVEMAAVNAKANLKAELGFLRLQPHIVFHPQYPAGTPRANVRQDVAMPLLASMFDWSDRLARPEEIYIHTLLLVAAAIEPLFAKMLDLVVGRMEEDVVIHPAPNKTFGRMEGKLRSAADHRYETKPRPALNIDIVRRLAEVQTTVSDKRVSPCCALLCLALPCCALLRFACCGTLLHLSCHRCWRESRSSPRPRYKRFDTTATVTYCSAVL